jgi:hypothetical protein
MTIDNIYFSLTTQHYIQQMGLLTGWQVSLHTLHYITLHYITLHYLDPKLVRITVECGIWHINT